MSRAIQVVMLTVVVLLVTVAGFSGTLDSGFLFNVDVVPGQPDVAQVTFRATQSLVGARIVIHGPLSADDVQVICGGTAAQVETMNRSLNLEFGRVGSGFECNLRLDVRRLAAGENVTMVAERRLGLSRWQVSHRLISTEAGELEVASFGSFRLTDVAARRATASNIDSEARNDGSGGFILVERLGAPASEKARAKALVFMEDPTGYAIPDGPMDCTGDQWTTNGLFFIDSAPDSAVSTEIEVSVNITHASMSDLHVGFFYDPDVPGGSGNFLWRGEAGVDLEQSFTEALAGQDMPGLGQSVNGFYSVSVRDCTEGIEGTLDYWSMQVNYESAASIDLTADFLGVAATTTVAPGDSFPIAWAGRVTGSGSTSGAFDISFHLSADAVVQDSDVLLEEITEESAMNAGDSFGQSEQLLTLPAGTADGAYYVIMTVDSGNVVEEENEGNNIASFFPLRVGDASNLANLVALSCSSSTTRVNPGDSVSLTWRGSNQGAVASGSFRWSIYAGSGESPVAGDPIFHTGRVDDGWAAGFDSGDLTTAVTVPVDFPVGSYSLGVFIDVADAVFESAEVDNWCWQSLIVELPTVDVTRWLIAAAASAPGVGTSNWKSQISVVNPSEGEREVNIFYVADGVSWPGELIAGPIMVPALASAYLDDPLLALSPTSGLIYVTLDGAGPVVTSRTYNLGEGNASFGQGIPAVAFSGVRVPTELILPMVHSSPDRFRTNLGLVQASTGTIALDVAIFAADGSLLAEKSYTLSAGFDQINNLFSNMGIGNASVEGAWVRVRLTSGTPDFWAIYASVVDNITGDPTYVAGVESSAVK